jgi:2-haloalkanoic acid dehalogenase type II
VVVLDVDAISLDLFGTLVRGGRAALNEAAKAVVEDHALPVTPDGFLQEWSTRYFATNDGPFVTIAEANDISLRETLEAFGVPPRTADYVRLLKEGYDKVEPFPEVPEFLERVKGYELCLLSNVDDDLLAEILSRHGLEFPHVVTSEAVKSYKPDPRIFQRALDELGLPPWRILHAGDTPEMDVLGARNMRMRAAWVNRRGEVLDDHVPAPDLEVSNLTELADRLEGVDG